MAGQIIQTNRLIPGAGSLLRSTAVLILAGVALQAPHARAQNLEPRAYTNAPVGMNFLIGGFLYTKGNIAVDPSVPLTDARLQTRSAVVAYAHAFDIGGQSAKFDVIVPYTALEGSALFAGAPVAREVTGFGDPALRVSVNFLGAPALPAQGFNGYQQDLIVGASVQVSAPWGQYDPARLVNLGTNRWAARAELGVSKARGAWILELAPGITWFADNDEFLGGKRREQAPVYSLQAHLVHSLPGGIWVSLDGVYYTGGRTTVDGVPGNDLQTNTRLGFTVALPVDRYNSIKLYGSTGVSTRTGGTFDAVGVAWQHRWGGGF